MVPRNDDAPLMLWHEAGLSADLAGRPNLLASLVSPEHVGPSVRWIRQDTEHPRMGQSTPEQFAIPGTAVRPPRKAKAKLLEAPDHGVGTAFSLEQFEDRSNGALHFLVRVERNLIVVENKANIDAAKAKYPGKPIKQLVLTHHHMDHSSGTRAYVAEGAEIVMPGQARPFFEKMFQAEHK